MNDPIRFYIGLTALLAAFVLVLIIISYVRRQQFVREAEQQFDELVRELESCVELPVHEVLMSVGIKVTGDGDPEIDME